MQTFELLLIAVLPMLVVGAVMVFILKEFFKQEKTKREEHWKQLYVNNLTPRKFTAYERMALFLERIRPTQLALRETPLGNLKDYELQLIKAIQSEWEHNLSQQIYVNPETWKIIFSAKNATQDFVRRTTNDLPEDASPKDLQSEIIKNSHKEWSPSDKALLKIQADVQAVV